MKQEMLEKYLRMLLASISHEIRNPLNILEGYLTVAAELSISDMMKSYLRKLSCAARQIDYALNGACYLTMTESGTIVLQPERFDLKQTVEQMIDFIQPILERKEVTVRFCVAPEVPTVILSDQKKFRLVLYHLLTNAAKYTIRGSIEVSVEFDRSSSILATTVRDTGCGIPPGKIPGLFSIFGNIENANRFNPQGMGLGLVLCKRLSKMLGGDIVVDSTQDVGTAFSFTVKCYSVAELDQTVEAELPLEYDDDKIVMNEIRFFMPHVPKSASNIKRHPSAAMIIEVSPANKKPCDCAGVLVVDDEPTNRLVIRTYLKGQFGKMEVDEAENGAAALSMVEAKAENTCCCRYKLILMDINMPVMDGTTATQLLMRLFEKNKELKAPIVAVTAANLDFRKDLQALLSVGFADILQKPVSKVEFLARISGYLK